MRGLFDREGHLSGCLIEKVCFFPWKVDGYLSYDIARGVKG